MEEIKVGDYYRTKNGLIRKVETIKSGKRQFTRTTKTLVNGKHKLEDIKSHSKIISEVVEVGDYVNGKLIHKIDKGQNYCYLYYGNCKTFVSYQIKTIVTHEQMSNIEYRLEN